MLVLLLLLLAAEPFPARIANPGFERGLDGWTTGGHSGFRASAMRIVAWSSDRPAGGRGWLQAGWAARSGAPPGAEFRITTTIDARRYRGWRVRFSAMTRAPDFADRMNSLTVGAGGRTAAMPIAASEAWTPHSVVLEVPRDAGTIELGFRLRRGSGELDADEVRLELVR